LLDERDWLTEQVKLDSVQLAEYQKALRQSIALEKQARNEAANLDTLYTIEVQRSEELQSTLNKEQKKVKRRKTLLWIVSAVAVVETAIIGISYGLSTR
jgi:predicted nucleic acid-binding Zn ribbon protein